MLFWDDSAFHSLIVSIIIVVLLSLLKYSGEFSYESNTTHSEMYHTNLGNYDLTSEAIEIFDSYIVNKI